MNDSKGVIGPWGEILDFGFWILDLRLSVGFSTPKSSIQNPKSNIPNHPNLSIKKRISAALL